MSQWIKVYINDVLQRVGEQAHNARAQILLEVFEELDLVLANIGNTETFEALDAAQ